MPGFKLTSGHCYSYCPFYANDFGNLCKDTYYDGLVRPYRVTEEFVNKDFSHAELVSSGWSYSKFET